MFDLDGFKTVNDHHGHHTGDALLHQIGHRLAATARDTDTIARIGGDEFAVLITGAHHRAEVQPATARLLATFDAPFDIDGQTLHVTPSAALVVANDPHIGPDELLRRADHAMYTAKRAGGGSVRESV